MQKSRHEITSIQCIDYALTKHAALRTQQRGINPDHIEKVIQYGRNESVRGAEIFAIGDKEVNEYLNYGIDLSKFKGIIIVCSHDGSIITAYRSTSMKTLRSHDGNFNRKSYGYIN